MRAFRLVKARHAEHAFDGEGARLFGGRWNPKGVAVAYASGSLALAVLELLVHLDPAQAPDDLVAVEAHLPDDLDARILAEPDLPSGWNLEGGSATLQALGSDWVREGRHPVLVVPSVIVPQEHNLLINPNAPESARLVLVRRFPFRFDPRLVHS
jgi:RES domain-containing protein